MFKRLIYFCCLIGLCVLHFDANALNCPDTTDQAVCEATTGCVFGGIIGCKACAPGDYYYKTTDANTGAVTVECKVCPTAYPDSDAGSTGGITDCYQKCENQTIDNGEQKPDSAKIMYDSSTPNPACKYTNQANITCNTNGGTCNMGFHRNGDQCISNANNCTNGYEFYINGNMTGCLVTSCGDGNVLVSINGATCNNTPYGECKPLSQPCANQPELNGKCSGTIGGNATRQINGTLNYSGCTCTTMTSIDNGQQNQKCNFDQSGTSPAQNCITTLSCNAGFCSTDNTTCAQAAEGFYSPNNDGTCHQCPTGAKSTAGSTQKSDCYYHSGTTFTDSTGGSFKLPVGSNHINVVNQNN